MLSYCIFAHELRCVYEQDFLLQQGWGGMFLPPQQHFYPLRGGLGWHKASVSDCLPLAAPIGLSPLLILTLRGSGRVLVVSTEPRDDLSCLTTPGVGCPGDKLSPVPLTRCIQKGGGGSLAGSQKKAAVPCGFFFCNPLC